MKVAVTATAPDLDAPLDPRFGRCPFFVIVDTESMDFACVDNANARLGSGAGIQSARLMADHDVQYVLTGNCGPNAHDMLSTAAIGIVVGCSGTVREAVQSFKQGECHTAGEPNVASHFGMGATNPQPGSGRRRPASPEAVSGTDKELESLKRQADMMQEQLQQVRERIAQLEKA